MSNENIKNQCQRVIDIITNIQNTNQKSVVFDLEMNLADSILCLKELLEED